MFGIGGQVWDEYERIKLKSIVTGKANTPRVQAVSSS
jgi:hypothetical protein